MLYWVYQTIQEKYHSTMKGGNNTVKQVLKNSIALVCFFAVILSGCMCDPYAGKRPSDYDDAKWVCEEPNIWFEVNSDEEESYYPKGEIVYNNQTIQVVFKFVNQTNRVFINQYSYADAYRISGDNCVFGGECEFSPEKLIIKIEKDTDTVFNGEYDELVFIRNDT